MPSTQIFGANTYIVRHVQGTGFGAGYWERDGGQFGQMGDLGTFRPATRYSGVVVENGRSAPGRARSTFLSLGNNLTPGQIAMRDLVLKLLTAKRSDNHVLDLNDLMQLVDRVEQDVSTAPDRLAALRELSQMPTLFEDGTRTALLAYLANPARRPEAEAARVARTAGAAQKPNGAFSLGPRLLRLVTSTTGRGTLTWEGETIPIRMRTDGRWEGRVNGHLMRLALLRNGALQVTQLVQGRDSVTVWNSNGR